MLAHAAVLAVAVWVAWRPAETAAETAAVVAAVALALTPWAWRRTGADAARGWPAALALVLVFLVWRGLCGVDPAAAIEELVLAAAVGVLVWLASREPAPIGIDRLLALGLAVLALWAAWQVTAGFKLALAQVDQLPAALQANALERLHSGRAFASLLVPGHLAVLLATAVPILVFGLRRGRGAIASLFGLLLCVLGILLTRSPIGALLAVVAVATLLGRRRQRGVAVGVGVLVAVLAAVVMLRADVAQLEPVRLRLDNWRTALWVWSGAPLTGVGVGGFGQTAQAVPFAVGNRPAHAHCLPLEWAAELGVVGVGFAVIAALALAWLVRRLWEGRPDLAVAVAIVPVHNLVDFSLYASGVALPWAVLVGWSLATVRRPCLPPRAATWGRLLMVLTAALMLAASTFHGVSVALERAAMESDTPEQAVLLARDAHRLAPWRVTPLTVLADGALSSHDPDLMRDAADLLDRWCWLSPGSVAFASLRGRLAEELGSLPWAVAETWSVVRRRPADEDARRHLEGLLGRLGGGRGERPR